MFRGDPLRAPVGRGGGGRPSLRLEPSPFGFDSLVTWTQAANEWHCARPKASASSLDFRFSVLLFVARSLPVSSSENGGKSSLTDVGESARTNRVAAVD